MRLDVPVFHDAMYVCNPDENHAALFSRTPLASQRDGARLPSRGTCRRDARTKRFETGSSKSAVPGCARDEQYELLRKRRGWDEQAREEKHGRRRSRRREGGEERRRRRWHVACERRFKGKKEETAVMKKKRTHTAQEDRKKEREEES